MSRYNHHINSHFKALRLLVQGRDEHRGRDVRIYMIPGDFKIVGMTDGIDAWIAPISVAPSPLFDKVRRVMHDIEQGKNPAVVGADDAQGAVRRKVGQTPVDEAPPPRRRVTETGRIVDDVSTLLTNAHNQVASLRRRNVTA